MNKVIQNFTEKIRGKNVVLVYYLLTFLIELAVGFTFAIYVIFLLSRGLNLLEANLVNLAFMSAGFLLEIPTGAYADFFGRKKSIIASCGLFALCLFVYAISGNIWMFIAAELIGALGSAFYSGALDAWMVDSLKEQGREEESEKVFSKANIIHLSASLVGGLLGAFLGNLNLVIPFAVGSVIALLALSVAISFMHENHTSKSGKFGFTTGLKKMGEVMRHSVNYGVRHKVVLWLIISSVISMFAFMPLNMFWAPRMNELAGNKVWLMGWVWVGVTLFMMLGGYLAKKLLENKKSYFYILILTSITLSIPILVSASTNIFIIASTSWLFYEIGRGLYKPVHKAYINKYIPSEQRATILSFDTMMGKLGAATGLLLFGWMGKNFGIQFSWIVSGLLLLLLIPIFMRVRKHTKNLEE